MEIVKLFPEVTRRMSLDVKYNVSDYNLGLIHSFLGLYEQSKPFITGIVGSKFSLDLKEKAGQTFVNDYAANFQPKKIL